MTDELCDKVIRAALLSGLKKIVIAGGVGANSMLRAKLDERCKKEGIEIYYPVLKYCTDNAAMIGSAAYYYAKDKKGFAELDLTAKPNVDL